MEHSWGPLINAQCDCRPGLSVGLGEWSGGAIVIVFVPFPTPAENCNCALSTLCYSGRTPVCRIQKELAEITLDPPCNCRSVRSLDRPSLSPTPNTGQNHQLSSRPPSWFCSVAGILFQFQVIRCWGGLPPMRCLPAMWTSGVARRMRTSGLCWLECCTSVKKPNHPPPPPPRQPRMWTRATPSRAITAHAYPAWGNSVNQSINQSINSTRVPLWAISAAPKADDIYQWVATIMGPEKSLYQVRSELPAPTAIWPTR